jgi:amidohydrolase
MTPLVDLSQDIHELTPGLIALRRALHQHPEPAFEEAWTAATLAGRMRALGLAVQEGIGGTGVLAMLDGAQPGKTLLIRGDIDALPMEDATGKAYASRLKNRNHACGHDVHSTVVAGVAEVLGRHRNRIGGRVAFVFQPADKPMRGARTGAVESLTRAGRCARFRGHAGRLGGAAGASRDRPDGSPRSRPAGWFIGTL